MNALFFGTSERALFGAYDPPRVKRTPAAGVVLCAPMGQEYMRAHKALRQLAMQLSKAGFHVLRFDYFGTGDSAGRCEDGSVEQWVADVGTAVDELKDTAGLATVSLVGLRLGATLAASAAADRADIDGLVLWDPIVDGADYLRQLIGLGVRADGSGRRFTSPPDAGDTVSVRGFPVTPRMRAAIERLDLASAAVKARRVFLVVSNEHDAYERVRARLAGAGTPFVKATIPSASSWESAAAAGGDLVAGAMVLPQQMIQGIVEWFTQETR